MATVFIAEFTKSAVIGTMQPPIAPMPPIAEQTVAVGGASATSAVFSSSTGMIRVHTDSVCSIAIGDTPVAAATNMRMAANTTEYFAVRPGQKLAVIANT